MKIKISKKEYKKLKKLKAKAEKHSFKMDILYADTLNIFGHVSEDLGDYVHDLLYNGTKVDEFLKRVGAKVE